MKLSKDSDTYRDQLREQADLQHDDTAADRVNYGRQVELNTGRGDSPLTRER